MSLKRTLRDLHAAFPDSGRKMPVLFVGHGNPLNAIEDNEYSRARAKVGRSLPLLYILSLQEKNEQIRFFADRVTMGSLSMRSLWIQ